MENKKSLYTIFKESELNKTDMNIVYAKLTSMIQYYLFLKEDNEKISDYIKTFWEEELKLKEIPLEKWDDILYRQFKDYNILAKKRKIQNLSLISLYHVLIDQSFKLWVLNSTSYKVFSDYDAYYDWLNILFLDKEKLNKDFNNSIKRFRLNSDNFLMNRNIFSNYERYTVLLYEQAKNLYLQKYLDYDFITRHQVWDNLLNHYKKVILEVDQLRNLNREQRNAILEYDSIIKNRDMNIISDIMNGIENSKYNYPISKLLTLLNDHDIKIMELKTIISSLLLGLNNVDIKAIEVPNNEDAISCYGWSYKENEIVKVIKGSDE